MTAREDAVRYLRDYLRDGDEESIRRAAESVFAYRYGFVNNGSLDLAGRSFAYRTAIAEVYSEAGLDVSHPERDRVMALLRYHIGNVAREQLTEEELEHHGLKKRGPRERQHARRVEAMDLAKTVTGRQRDVVKSLMVVTLVLANVRTDVELNVADEKIAWRQVEAMQKWVHDWYTDQKSVSERRERRQG